MYPRLNIYFDEGTGLAGGGPDEDPRFPVRTLRSHGFLSLTFGFALGLTFMIFFGMFRIMANPPFGLGPWVTETHPNLWYTFLFGFITGTLFSAIYNFLIFRRLNLFGLNRNMD